MQASELSSVATKVVSDHEIHLFYKMDHGEGTLSFNQGPNAVLGGLAEKISENEQSESVRTSTAPARLLAALAKRYALAKAFDITTLDFGRDFHEHIADLASGRRHDLLKIFTLSEIGKRLFAKGDLYPEDTPIFERKPHHLILNLSKAAANRLANFEITAKPYIITIENALVSIFRTGKGFTQVRVRVQPMVGGQLSALELLEVQIALGRIHTLHWIADGEIIKSTSEGTTLGTLIRTLVLGPGSSAAAGDRVTTYTFMRFDELVEPVDADRLALYSARHYTSDYMVTQQVDGVQRVRHFETVGHVVALEGACTIVAPARKGQALPDFLKMFKEATFRSHYVPLMLFALHEQGFLIDRTSQSVSTPDNGNSEKLVKGLTTLRRDSLMFRLLYRFSQVSYITMHNAMNQAFRAALKLDTMLNELSGDIAAVEAFFRTLREKRQAEEDRKAVLRQGETERRYYIISVLGTAALAALTSFTIVKEASDVFPLLFGKTFGIWVGLGVFFIACFVGYLKRPIADTFDVSSEHPHHDFTTHAELEHLLHTLNK